MIKKIYATKRIDIGYNRETGKNDFTYDDNKLADVVRELYSYDQQLPDYEEIIIEAKGGKNVAMLLQVTKFLSLEESRDEIRLEWSQGSGNVNPDTSYDWCASLHVKRGSVELPTIPSRFFEKQPIEE